MLKIRLQRVGKAKHPTYRVLVSEGQRDLQGTYLEKVGIFDPHAAADQFKPVRARIEYWLSQGAKPSTTVFNLLVNAGILTGKKKRSVFLSKSRVAKIAEKKKSATPAPAPQAPAVVAAAEAPAA